MGTLLQDLSFAFRQLRRPKLCGDSRPHACPGIGANTAIFSLVDSILLKPPTTSPIICEWSVPQYCVQNR